MAKDYKPFLIRLRTIDVSQSWSETSPDDYDYDSDDFAIDGGSSSLDGDYSGVITGLIGDSGEYLDWMELEADEVFCEEWIIYNEDIIEELTEYFFGFDDVELVVEESLTEWEKINSEWHRVG